MLRAAPGKASWRLSAGNAVHDAAMAREQHNVDWSAAAASLVERLDRPTVLLDEQGRICLFNGSMEELLGRRRIEVLDRLWVDEFVPKEEAESASWRLKEALAGTVDRCECPVITRSGQRLLLTLDIAPLGHQGRPALLAVVTLVKHATEPLDHHGVTVLNYEISTATSDFGRIRKVSCTDEALCRAAVIGEKCFTALHHRSRPCEGCPALLPDGATRRSNVVPSKWDDAPFAIVTGEPSEDGSRRMTAYFLGRSVVAGLTRARVNQLAESAGLSDREREVLDLLLLGRSPREMSHALGISERTIKFHQTNILGKVGADSRLDIFRLLS
jgi:PAS domain S-box-containing protein